MALSSWPATPHAWLDEWIVWRFGDGRAATRPAAAPPTIPLYALEFQKWCAWKRLGRPDPRPDINDNIPVWAFQQYANLNKKVPIALPVTPHTWLMAWAIWRFKNMPPEGKPAGLPSSVTDTAPYAWGYLKWLEWQRKGKPLPRPTIIPKSIPAWAFDHLRKVNQAVPPPPVDPEDPPPPPPPPPPPTNSSWKLPNPIMFTAWGWLSDSQYRDNNEALVRMRDAGVKTVALQIGQFNGDVPGRVRAFGMKVALWGSPHPDDGQALALAGADGYIPQIETPGEYQAAITNLEAGVGAGLSISTVTTLYGIHTFTTVDGRLTTVEAERLKAAGCNHGWIECYIQDGGAHFPISKMMWAADQRGLDFANPLLGLWREFEISAYRPPEDPSSLASYGKQVGGYLSETMTPNNWRDFAALGT